MRDRRPTFADVYDEHVWNVYGFFAYRVGRRQDAEDLTQATFERALRAWGRYDPDRSKPGTWLLTIARNLLVDHYRADQSARHREIGPEAEARHLVPGPEDDLGIDPEIEQALAGLSGREREVVALRFGADLTGQQIADLTGSSLSAIQQALSRALRRLRGELEDEGHAASRSA